MINRRANFIDTEDKLCYGQYISSKIEINFMYGWGGPHCNPSPWEGKVKGLQLCRWLEPHGKFQASLGYKNLSKKIQKTSQF